MLSMFAIIFTIIVQFCFQTQLISNPSNPEHINHVPPAQIQGLNSGMPIQESVDGWIRTTQSTQSEVHGPDSNLDEDRRIEVIAW